MSHDKRKGLTGRGTVGKPQLRIRGPGEGVSFVIPALFVVPTKAGIQTLESFKLSPHRVPTILSQQGFSEVQDCGRGGVQCFLRRCTMDSRQSGNDGEGCRNDGEGAGNDGLVLWSPYPKLGLTGTFTSPYGKGWSAQMAGHSRALSTTLPQRHTRPCGLTPHPLIRNWGYVSPLRKL